MAAIDIDGGVPATTLNGAITSGATSFTVADGGAYPDGTNGNFYVVIGLGTASEEVIECSARSVNTLTAATRGADGTSAASHDNGASVQHVVPALALQEANTHANQTTGTPHGSAYVTPTGNVATATALENERSIILSGDVSGTSSLFDGTANATITTTLADPISVDTSGNAATASALESPVTIGGISFDGSGSINLPGVNTTGNQNTLGSAAKWTTARTLSVNGDMTGNVSIDGSQDVTLTLAADLEAADIPDISASQVTGLNDSHTHNTQYYDKTTSDSRYLAAGAKAADSDKLDNLNSSQFLRSDTNDTFSGDLTVSGGLTLGGRDLGEIVSFTPTWDNVSGSWQSNTGYYAYVKDLVYISVEAELSASTSVNSTIRLTLPVTGSDTHQSANGMMQVQLLDHNENKYYQGMTVPYTTSKVEVRYNIVVNNEIFGQPATTGGPFTWADGDKILISGVYRSGS